jgi:hypothetical protein
MAPNFMAPTILYSRVTFVMLFCASGVRYVSR